MSIEKQGYPAKCCNKNCQNSDDSGSGCLCYSKWTVDMCGEFHSELNLLLDCKELVKMLANWSRKYPREKIYHMASKETIDGELIKIEEVAKKLAGRMAI